VLRPHAAFDRKHGEAHQRKGIAMKVAGALPGQRPDASIAETARSDLRAILPLE